MKIIQITTREISGLGRTQQIVGLDDKIKKEWINLMQENKKSLNHGNLTAKKAN